MKKTINIFGWSISALLMIAMAAVGYFSHSLIIMVPMAVGIGGYMTAVACGHPCMLNKRWLGNLIMALFLVPVSLVLLVCLGGPVIVAVSAVVALACLSIKLTFAACQAPLPTYPESLVYHRKAKKAKIKKANRFSRYFKWATPIRSRCGKWVVSLWRACTGWIHPIGWVNKLTGMVMSIKPRKRLQRKKTAVIPMPTVLENRIDIPEIPGLSESLNG